MGNLLVLNDQQKKKAEFTKVLDSGGSFNKAKLEPCDFDHVEVILLADKYGYQFDIFLAYFDDQRHDGVIYLGYYYGIDTEENQEEE